MCLNTKAYWLTDCQSQCDFDFDFHLRRKVQKPETVPRSEVKSSEEEIRSSAAKPAVK
jgi:hypothetical protein